MSVKYDRDECKKTSTGGGSRYLQERKLNGANVTDIYVIVS